MGLLHLGGHWGGTTFFGPQIKHAQALWKSFIRMVVMVVRKFLYHIPKGIYIRATVSMSRVLQSVQTICRVRGRCLNSRLRDCQINTFLDVIHVYELSNCTDFSLNGQEWKSTLLGFILGITSFGVEIHRDAQNSGIHSQKSDSNHYFGVDSTILRVDFHSKRSDP